MSIKRSRELPRRRSPEPREIQRGPKAPERVYRWAEDVEAHSADPFVAYAPAHRYAEDVRLVHKVFGAGIVTKVEGTKIEVLFKEGPKKLAQNPAGAQAPPASTMTAAPQTAQAPAPSTDPAPESGPPPAAAPAPASLAQGSEPNPGNPGNVEGR
jgi:hypothetical protein